MLSAAGWVAAAAAMLLAVAVRWRLQVRMEAVARACHELRGPLTAARLGLTHGVAQARPTAGRLRAVDAELCRAAAALDDLADPRGGPPRLGELRRVSIRAMLEDCVEAWQGVAAAADRELSLSWTGRELEVWIDRPRLARAVENLISNALEHGAGAVEVDGRKVAGRLRVVVADEGPGLPAPVPRLCRSRRRGGRGRGLQIAVAIASAHGGAIVSAPTERGARLVLELPLAIRVGVHTRL